MSKKILDYHYSDALLERARIFLKDVEINDEFLEFLGGHGYYMAYDIDAYNKVCEEGREDDDDYRLEIAKDISGNLNTDSPEYRLAFLLERGMNEDQLKARISMETCVRTFLESVDNNDEILDRESLHQLVREVALKTDAYECACKTDLQDDKAFLSGLADKIANKITLFGLTNQIAFLFERGYSEGDLKDKVFRETTPCP